MRKVWAVARNTISQILRMKVALLVIVGLLIILPLMGMIVTGDGTLKGKLQTFISYGLSLTGMLLSILTIIVATYTLTSDLKYKQIYLILSKPVHRFQIVCGKLLGIVILDAFLLAVFAAIIYGLTMFMPKLADADETEMAQAQREFFTARASVEDPIDLQDVVKEVRERYQRLKRQGQIPEGMGEQEALNELFNQERIRRNAVAVGKSREWEFEDVKLLGDDEHFSIEYKYNVAVNPPDSKVYGTWFVGDLRQETEADVGEWETPIYRLDPADVIRTVQEIQVPADAIAADGYVAARFVNTYQNNTTVIPKDVKLLYESGTFEGNFVRAVLMIMTKLTFLAALGVFVSTWLSFPVGVLVSVAVFFIGTFNGFMLDSFTTLSHDITAVYYSIFKGFLWLLPQFDGRFNPTEYMIGAEAISMSVLSQAMFYTVIIKAGILTLLGIVFFRLREVAKVIV
ncbi:ABC-type transport system involved in multi-copper enzyme maturation, permease component [Anaerohalosphaera lusitana]|uniref:ABC-type transport system involved in multi-copper enzyme maturation, permease component n=1 Tax=Anaerohalosphaera lusitana TaxID=1936003 RepID=A0A1U9NM20_9BACT|nr:ABC transporter permease [Anaerohalosphaera lusitana]AQT68857.1 ABC-type transport system involved in multi-copper enzyme maturation, permease component [Anaerohalosphaera lusitana]